jgi:hypothetical protein
MPICPHTETCAFFNTDVGYSPELNDVMKNRFCLQNNESCARRAALSLLGEGNVPAEMLPTDDHVLDDLGRFPVC